MITRNNYEEFFLLYVDNELSPAERQAVEEFVDGHPDLKEEWELLLQCRMSPDEGPAFLDKEGLLKQGAQWQDELTGIGMPGSKKASLIDAGNYETWFLSYIDGELDEPARQAVVDFVRLHPEKGIELQRLQQTVNIPDPAILFPDKELLYRREDRKKIAWLPFARIAAAALVLGAIGLLFFHPFRTDSPLAGAPSSGKAHLSAAAVTDTPSSTLASASHSTQTLHPVPAGEKISGEKIISNETAVKKQSTTVTPGHTDPLYLSNAGHKNRTVQKDDEEKEASDPVLAKVETRVTEKVVDRMKSSETDNDPSGKTGRLAIQDPKMLDQHGKGPATVAVTGELADGGNRNASFATQALLSQSGNYIEGESSGETASPKKNKFRGIFRKVTRVLEKSAGREEDDNKKVLIGGFQFALK